MRRPSAPDRQGEAVSRISETIRRRIEERWRDYFPSHAASTSPDVMCPDGATTTLHSILFEFRLVFHNSNAVPPVIAKVRRNTLTGGAVALEAGGGARAEHEELSKAYRYYSRQKDGLSVVRPIDYLPELDVILAEKAAGDDLAGLAILRHTDCSEQFARFGRWLYAFHHCLHQCGHRTWGIASIEVELKTERDKLMTRDVSSDRLNSLIESYLKKARSLLSQDVPVSVVHGDCKLRHVWGSPESIQVLDFGCVKRGDCYEDVADFLADLMQIKVVIPWFSRKKLEAYRHSFLTGYFGDTAPPEILSLYIIRSLYLKWCVRLDLWGTQKTAYWKVLRRRLPPRAKWIINRVHIDRWFANTINEILSRKGRQSFSMVLPIFELLELGLPGWV